MKEARSESSTRSEPPGRRHSPQRRGRVRQMFQDLTRRHEIEGLGFEFLLGDVVLANLQVWGVDGFEELGLEVGRDDLAIRPDPAAEPFGDRAAASTNLQATPPFADPDFLEAFGGERVKARLDSGETLAFGLVLMGEEVRHCENPRYH